MRTAAPVKKAPARAGEVQDKRILNAGGGRTSIKKMWPVFQSWRVVNLDINPKVKPDIIGSITDMRDTVRTSTFNAIWCSHNLEHLYDHEVIPALREFHRVLTPDGIAVIACPDLMQVAELIMKSNIEDVVYQSPSGPVRALDMLYGFAPSIAAGNEYMAHRTGFTEQRLGTVLVKAGFSEVWISKGNGIDLWAVALKQGADRSSVKRILETSGQNFLIPS